jgi:SAM-dependent methyltransferase
MEEKFLLQKPEYDEYENWHTVTCSNSVEQVKNIITGCSVWEETAMPKTVWNRNSQNIVLDFGCGLGRNAKMLRNYFIHVIGYDLDQMLEMLNIQSPFLYDYTSSNLHELLQEQKITHIYESVVWQHINWDSGVIQLALDLITNQETVISIYTCWNSDVDHQLEMVFYLFSKGWNLEQYGEVEEDQLITLADVPHSWYLFVRDNIKFELK